MTHNHIDFEPLLPLVEKPSRYINHEVNAIHKSFKDAEVRFCFAFPDVYELGISHLGLKILYSIVNSLEYAMADRTYLPWLDMIKLMREKEIPLWGLESRASLSDFDVVGVTLQSELNYTNILELLDLSKIPVLAKNRTEEHPIVMAGGPCATNPLPLCDFIDVFFIGEAEEGIVEIAEILRRCGTREERMQALADLPSCYVPAIHGSMPDQASFRVKARKYSTFHEGKAIHSPQILPWQLATHNRYVAEIMRGCSRGCRFCHAGYFYRPVRERNADDILEELVRETRQSGWDEAGLISLSSSDYSCIKPLLLNLLNALDTNQTHVSLPSLRVDSLDDELVSSLKDLGREGLTIAPEAGSQRLRNVINKNLTEEQILFGITTALNLGWQKIKLYFMIGLPTETDADIDAIIELIQKIDSLAKRKLQINVTLSPFVPKTFTPLQWEPFSPLTQTLNRIMRVKHAFSTRRNIKIKYHNLESSQLEAILSRGDRSIGKVIHAAWQDGAIYDGWNESFDFSHWQKALDLCAIPLPEVLSGFSVDDVLPWDFVDTGVCKSFLLNELTKARNEETTEDCRDLCSVCGICDETVSTIDAPKPTILIPPVEEPVLNIAQRLQDQYHYRVFYQKLGMLRFISHLDWMRMLFRWIAGIPLETVFTQGFNPHPKVSLSPPLPVGVIGENEYFDVSYLRLYNPEEILERFKDLNIPDFVLLRVDKLTKAEMTIPVFEELSIDFSPGFLAIIQAKIKAFNALDELIFTKVKDGKVKEYDLRDIIQTIELTTDNSLRIIKKLQSPSLFSILKELLGLGLAELYTFKIARKRLHT